jgi:mRNA-degrading endonuclease RelE of RelBE toxin-antitoxin system
LYVVAIETTVARVRRRVRLGPDATRQLRKLRAYDARSLKDAMRRQLEQADATKETSHRFRLRRLSDVAEFELRVGDWRVFYRVDGEEVQVVLIGQKRGEKLFIDGRRFTL